MAIEGQFEAAEGSRPGDILERFALAAPLDEGAQGVQFRRGQDALEIQIELHARHLKEMGQEQLDLQSRRGDALFRQKIGAALNDFQDGHRDELKFKYLKS